MNRRQFGLRLAALSAAPLLPALPAAAAQPLSGTAARIYPWAAQYARVHGSASAAQIASVFNISPAAAGQVAQQLIAKGVTSAPALGVMKAVKPISWEQLYRPAPASLPTQLKETAQKLLRAADLEATDERAPLTEATETGSEPTPESRPTGSEESPPA